MKKTMNSNERINEKKKNEQQHQQNETNGKKRVLVMCVLLGDNLSKRPSPSRNFYSNYIRIYM